MRCLVSGLAFIFCLLGTTFAQDASLTPTEVVKMWLKVYPNKLEQAADLTTLSFRQGVSKKDWVTTQEPLLHGLRLRYSHATVKYEEIQGEEARVVV